jgi:thymidylate synthase ThyX
MIQSKIIADSINSQGDRLTTFVVTFPRIILAEFNTHRMFSRNSASSRAIPFKKMVESVHSNPFIPIAWQIDHKGMQGTEYITDYDLLLQCKWDWLQARDFAVQQAESLNKSLGVTKQLCNRLLEPFMWHTVIITSGKEGLDNFFKLRDHEDAEIHIQELAKRMKESISNSTPKQLQAGEWHIPFGDNIDLQNWYNTNKRPTAAFWNELEDYEKDSWNIKVATANCARVSYTVVGEEGKESNYINDIKLHDRLLASKHMSPAEHCCQVTNDSEWYFNFKGFKSYRYIIEKNV